MLLITNYAMTFLGIANGGYRSAGYVISQYGYLQRELLTDTNVPDICGSHTYIIIGHIKIDHEPDVSLSVKQEEGLGNEDAGSLHLYRRAS